MRPSGLTAVLSVMISPAPPTARLPRWTKCQSPTTPSSAEYMHMGETTIRFSSSVPRSRKGVKIGGGVGLGAGTPACLAALRATHRSTLSTKPGSRTFRLSWVIRSERVSSENANWIGSSRPK